MSSKTDLENKEKNKLIYCKNCRQDIASDKMFLHEGFCLRNNIFCEHCEKVFLKKDYKEHKKEVKKNKKRNLKIEENSSNNKNSTSNQEFTPIIQHTITNINPNPSLEFIQMPVVEEISINAPIIINETGSIVSNTNKNEFLLPILGIKSIPGNSTSDENYLFNNIQKQFIFQTENNSNINNKYNKYNVYTSPVRIKRLNNGNKGYYKSGLNYAMNNNQNLINQEMNNYNNNLENYDILNGKKNNFIDYFEKAETPKKLKISFSSNNAVLKKDPEDRIKQKTSNSKDSTKHPMNRRRKTNNKIISNNKEPKDSRRKLLTEPQTNNKKVYKGEKKNKWITTNKKREVIKICGFCNSIIKDFSHFDYCNSEKLNKKQQNEIYDRLLTEILEKENLEEFGIEDNKKKILHREFIHNFKTTSNNKGSISPQRIIEINKDPFISKIKKQLFSPKNLNNKFSNNLLNKSQERNYTETRPNKNFFDKNVKSVERPRRKLINLNYKLSPKVTKPNDRYKYNTSNDFTFDDSNNGDKEYIFKKNQKELNYIRI